VARPWDEVRDEVRGLVLGSTLVRAVAAGRRRGVPLVWRRAELRPVDLKAGRRLQVVTYDERQAHTANYDPAGAEAIAVVDGLLAQGFGNWHVETLDEVVQVRITKKGDAQVHRSPRVEAPDPSAGAAHDRVKPRLLDPAHPDVAAFLTAVGVADRDGRIKPSRQDKYRQVEQFVRLLDAAIEDAVTAGALRPATAEAPWRVVDLGCGNAYLTLGAYVWLARVRDLPVRVHGVDVRESFRDRNTELAERLGWSDALTFEAASIADAADPEGMASGTAYDVVLALHACDTATDDALARAVRWGAAVVLAAPCCHHDLQTQVSVSSAPSPYAVLARHGLLRERFVDVLTDGIRAAVLRLLGYRVDTVEFVSDTHTPRNLMIRAVRTGAPPARSDVADYDRLVAEWGLRPALAERLPDELALARGDR
jgi:SAM-dependent methyltransferase